MHSKTPGHPEVGITPGVETTTGPLGQGLANAVGMALAEKLLAAEFNRPGHTLVDHRTYAFVGDGCLMEGISHEACSLAGTLRLSKLVALYDDNGISIDGDVEGWFTDDTPARFRAYGWHVVGPVDGHDSEAVDRALAAARAQGDDPAGKPTLIVCRTVIGQGAPTKAGGHDVHGSPLGTTELAALRTALGWTWAPFEVPEHLRAAWDGRERGAALQADWAGRWAAYRTEHPALAAEFQRRMAGDLPANFDANVTLALERLAGSAGAVATRKASQLALDALAPALPELFGGSADLTGVEPDQFQGLHLGRSRPPGQPPELGRARIRHGRGAQRHGAARRFHPLRRHLPDLQRLQPQRHPHGGADEAARDPRLHARQHRPGRRRADPPERGTCAVVAADPSPGRLAPGGYAGNGRRLGRVAAPARRPQRAGAVAPGRAGGGAAGRAWRRRSPAAATCWPTRPARVP